MALEQHPNVFRFDSRLWVSREPGSVARDALAAQRRWDSAHLRSQRWALAAGVGGVLGTAATLGLGVLVGLGPAAYLLLLPLGFGAGVVLGAIVNKRLLGARLDDPGSTPRPEVPELTRIPSAVARYTDESTGLDELIEWSSQGFVPKERRPRG